MPFLLCNKHGLHFLLPHLDLEVQDQCTLTLVLPLYQRVRVYSYGAAAGAKQFIMRATKLLLLPKALPGGFGGLEARFFRKSKPQNGRFENTLYKFYTKAQQ